MNPAPAYPVREYQYLHMQMQLPVKLPEVFASVGAAEVKQHLPAVPNDVHGPVILAVFQGAGVDINIIGSFQRQKCTVAAILHTHIHQDGRSFFILLIQRSVPPRMATFLSLIASMICSFVCSSRSSSSCSSFCRP